MRTDGDTWDIVTGVGATALGVAAFRAVETERADSVIIPDTYARAFVQAADEPRFTALLSDPSSFGDNFFPDMMGPRTRYFDDFFTEASATGVRQAVILAAGLDARAFRLDWPAGTTVFEIDKPAVLQFKDKVLADEGAQAKADRRTVAVDLRDDWPSALTAAGFDPQIATAWSAEGLLSYLPGSAQDALFERIDALSASGSRLAEHGQGGSEDIRRFQQLTNSRARRAGLDEMPDLFYDDPRADPVEWLHDRGWIVDERSVTGLFEAYGRAAPSMSDVSSELVAMYRKMSFWSAVKP